MISSGRKKIVYLIGTLDIGGAERQIVESVTRLNRQIFEPKLYGISGGGPLVKDVLRRGVAVTTFNGGRSRLPNVKPLFLTYPWKLLALWRYLKQEQPEIVHSYMYSPSIYGRITARLTGHPVIIASHRRLEHFKDAKPHYRFLDTFLDSFTDMTLVNSQAVKHDVLQRETIRPEKICLIYNGVDTQMYKPLGHPFASYPELLQKKQALGIPPTASVVGIIANLIPTKGYREFLLAAAEIHHYSPETRFLCIGRDRGIRGQLEQFSRELGLHRHLIFTGQVQNVPEILHLIDIQVSASHEEGFSNVILEGMASGKPIVATAVGGTPEAVVPNVTGLLVPPQNPAVLAQAIRLLLEHREFASQLGHHGRKRVEEHFTMEKMMHALETLYLKLSSARKDWSNCT